MHTYNVPFLFVRASTIHDDVYHRDFLASKLSCLVPGCMRDPGGGRRTFKILLFLPPDRRVNNALTSVRLRNRAHKSIMTASAAYTFMPQTHA